LFEGLEVNHKHKITFPKEFGNFACPPIVKLVRMTLESQGTVQWTLCQLLKTCPSRISCAG
jgi:hypothetical protein